jgi:hypothetical protein
MVGRVDSRADGSFGDPDDMSIHHPSAGGNSIPKDRPGGIKKKKLSKRKRNDDYGESGWPSKHKKRFVVVVPFPPLSLSFSATILGETPCRQPTRDATGSTP